MEHCSYELSIQLRDAGFPQPKFESCQFWWQVRLPEKFSIGGPVLCVHLPDGPYRWMPTDSMPIVGVGNSVVIKIVEDEKA